MQSWIFKSLIVLFFSACLVISMKLISIKQPENELICIAITLTIVGIFALFYILYHIDSLKNLDLSFNGLYPIVLLVICMLINYPYFQKAVSESPNAAYSHAIINSNVLLVLLFSIIILKSKYDIYSIIGIILGICGISLIAYNNN